MRHGKHSFPRHAHARRLPVAAAVAGALLLTCAILIDGSHHAVAGTSAAGVLPGSATSTVTGGPPSSTTASRVPAVTAPVEPARQREAVAAVDNAAAALPGTRYGVAILDRATGLLTLGKDGATPFYSASVVKLFLVADILHRAEASGVPVPGPDVELIQRALSLSDDDAMDRLWVAYDGPAAISQLVALAGLHETAPPTDPSQWGETRISAGDVVAVYQYVLDALTPGDRDLVLTALANASNTGADGFDQAFGLLDPPRLPFVKAKQGWMIDGTQLTLHTTGLLGSQEQVAVALLTMRPAGIGYAQGETDTNAVTGALLAALGPGVDR